MKKVLFYILICITICGCARINHGNFELSAEQLATEGMNAYDNGKYKTALKYFEKLKDYYPFSKYAILAELKTADSYYYLKNYNEAVAAYEDFINLHPKNEAVPYVTYQIGMSYFDRSDTFDRDQESTRKSLDTLKSLIANYPKSEYVEKANLVINKCLKKITAHELYIGMFYFKSKHYKAAYARFNDIIEKYPDSESYAKAAEYIKYCENALNDKEKE